MRVRSGRVGRHRRAPRAAHRRTFALITAIGLAAGVVVVVLPTADAVQASGHDVAAWNPGYSWTYASTFNYNDGNGTNVTINENVTYAFAGVTTFAGQSAYQLTLSGTITGGSGNANANGTNVSLSSFSGSVSGTEYIRRSDLALLQEYQHQDLKAKAAGLVGVTAVVDLTLTPAPGWHSLDFPLNAGDSYQQNEQVAYTGGFVYDAGSFGSGSSPFDGTFPFVGGATVSSQTITVAGSSTATDFVAASSSDGSAVDNQNWSPAHRNVVKEHLQLPMGSATLVLDRTLTSAALAAPANSVTETITPSLSCAGNTVTVAGTLSTNASGVPVSVTLDESAAAVGAGQTVTTTTGTNGAYTATLSAPADSDGLAKNGSRGNWGVLVSAPSAAPTNVATLVVTPQDCSSIAYTGATSAPQGGTATVKAKLTDLATPANAAGRTVTFSLSGGSSVTGTTDPSGVATATLPVNGPVRSATVTASVAAASDLTAATTSAAFTVTVDPTTTAVVASEPSATIGDPVTFTATVTPGIGSNPTGSVQFVVDGANFGAPAPVSGGTATSAAISTLPLGSHSVYAVYGGDANFAGSTSPAINLNVHNPLLPTTTSSTPAPSPSVYGQQVTITTTVVPKTGSGTPTGSVEYIADGVSLGTAALAPSAGGAEASFATSALAVGAHSIVANYSGDDVYNGSSSTSSVTVTPAATTTVVGTNDATTVTGEGVDVTATVAASAPGAGTPTGSVTLTVDGAAAGTATLVGGVATFAPLTGLHAGSHTLSVAYSGDGSFATSSGTAAQTVTKADTTTTLNTTPSPSAEEQAVAITATVTAVAPGSGAPTGTVTFFADGDPIGAATLASTGGSSEATISVTTLTPGTHLITASYAGDGDFVASAAAPVSQTVISGAAVQSTVTQVSSSVNPSTYGQLITFTAVVSAADSVPSGAVQFSVDGANVGGPVPLDAQGAAVSPTLASPDPGDHTVIAAFVPDAGFAASGDSITQTIADAGVDVQLNSSQPSSSYGTPVTFTATVASTQIGTAKPTGAVQFRVDGKPLGDAVALDDGSATSQAISTLLPGDHLVSVLYSGDVDFVAGLASATQSVAKVATSTTLTASRTSTSYLDPVSLTATVTPAGSSLGVPGGTVTFTDGATTLATVAAAPAAGTTAAATVVLSTLGGGSHSIKATYSGSSSFEGSTSNTVTVAVARRATIMKADAAILKITPPMSGPYGILRITLSSVGGPIAGAPITFTIGSATICTTTTGADGVATCDARGQVVQLLLFNGYKATFAGNANYLPVSAQGAVLK